MITNLNPLYFIGANIESLFKTKKPTPEHKKQLPEQENFIKSILDSEPSLYAWVNFQ